MAVEQWQPETDESQDWRQLAKEIQTRLAATEKACQAWMKTAQLAEDWADQLGKVRQWLQEQLLAQSQELNEAQHDKERALAETAALREQLEAAKQALMQKHEASCQLEPPANFRVLRWARLKLAPPHTLHGRLVSKTIRVTRRLLRRSA
jgi:hypothetical protein